MRGSIVYQVDTCITQVDKIGTSKREARKQGIKNTIHGKKDKNEVRKISRQFVKWARFNHDVKNMHDLTEEHYRDFLKEKSHLSLGYQRSIETNLRSLQEGLKRYSERHDIKYNDFIPEKRLIAPANRLEGVSDRSVSLKDINAIKANVSENVRNSIELMHNMGFRVSGSVSIKVENINFDKGIVSVIEKGGRYREVSIPQGFEKTLAGMIEGKESHERLVPIKPGTVSDAVKKASEKLNVKNYTGTHAFRHTYARNRVNELMTKNEMDLFQRCLSQYATGKDFNYGVHDRELYNSMKSKMDQVHKEIGHGNNRFDLALRYMR